MWSPWGFLYIVLYHLHRVTILPLLFQFGYLLFLLFVWLLWLGLPILCWIKVRMGILVLFQILVERLSPFLHWVLHLLWVCHKWLYVKLCSLYTHFCKSFDHEWMLDFVKCFFCVYWDDHVVFDLSFVNAVYDVDWFVYVEPSLWTWDESHLVMVYNLFYVLLDSVG